VEPRLEMECPLHVNIPIRSAILITPQEKDPTATRKE